MNSLALVDELFDIGQYRHLFIIYMDADLMIKIKQNLLFMQSRCKSYGNDHISYAHVSE
jgi:hypothetical protein